MENENFFLFWWVYVIQTLHIKQHITVTSFLRRKMFYLFPYGKLESFCQIFLFKTLLMYFIYSLIQNWKNDKKLIEKIFCISVYCIQGFP